jgi:hypothetical protein
MTNADALREALEHVPADVHAALTAAGFVPTGDAGNLWFYDRGSDRLLFGEDGSDYPRSLRESVTVCHDRDGSRVTNYATLSAALEKGGDVL